MDYNDEFREKAKSGSIFFFAGSGVSYNSHMPSAGKVLSKTLDVFLSDNDQYDIYKKKIFRGETDYTIQPEIFYENLLLLTNDSTSLSLWKCLSPNICKLYQIPYEPNINHLYIVNYSIKNKVPIFTTNFDCLFEEAARKLNYCEPEIILPYTDSEKKTIDILENGKAKPGVLYIFKLHGTIAINDKDTPDNLHTTMSSITRVNFPTISFIERLCSEKHMVFVGYSGRDIDYFPEIRRRKRNKAPFWIDMFNDNATKSNCEHLNAISILSYPDSFFRELEPELFCSEQGAASIMNERLFMDLQLEIKNSLSLNKDEEILFLSMLLSSVGEYKDAYMILLSLYRNNTLSDEKHAILLIKLSQMAHENSRYESCALFAKEALMVTRKHIYLKAYRIASICQFSESRRMLVAHDTYFITNLNYYDIVMTIFSFLFNTVYIAYLFHSLKEDVTKTPYIFALHSIIEHKIRFVAIIQGVMKPLCDRTRLLKSILRRILNSLWDLLRKESVEAGYSHGIANTYKFQTRINSNVEALINGELIYDLTSASTGKGLALRNRADHLFNQGDYENAKTIFYKFMKISVECGNKLNAIKALLGVARCNKKLSIKPSMTADELLILKNIMAGVEGKNWRNSFAKILKIICSNGG
ncbi:MAG: SIR2 family protein [Candidatus Magnetobacterium sp. LHC-1]|nr:SIR2 family protein [Nitrospirota bacterium]